MVENIIYSILGILIPFWGTSLGSSFVMFMKKDINEKIKKIVIGFASGVMIAASIWSLILPSIEMAEEQGNISYLPASIGFTAGILFLILINNFETKIENKYDRKKIPEGMAVRCMLCRIFGRECRNINYGGFYFCNRYSYSKYSRRSYNFNATKNKWCKQKKSIFYSVYYQELLNQ